MIQAVVFDMGGVLMSEQEGKVRLAEMDLLLGWKQGALHQRLYSGPAWEAYSTGKIDGDAYWAEVGADLEASLPPDFPSYRDNFHGAPLDTHTVELAWKLRTHYRIALLSNATYLLEPRLQQEPALRGLFDEIVISAHEGIRKPDPSIYLLTGQRLQLPLASCILIDDKKRNTGAARAVGMKAIEHRNAGETEQRLQELGMRIQ